MNNSINNYLCERFIAIGNLSKHLYFKVNNIENNNSNLSGLNFVITGSLNHFANRDEVKDKIEAAGGKVSGSVSAKTSYLVNNDIESTSGKNKKAKELGVKIITEDELVKMLNS
jgi:DNA ligase (NAD+)